MTCATNQGCSGTGIRDSSSECGSVRQIYCWCDAGMDLHENDRQQKSVESASMPQPSHCRFCALDGGR